MLWSSSILPEVCTLKFTRLIKVSVKNDRVVYYFSFKCICNFYYWKYGWRLIILEEVEVQKLKV